MKVLSNKVAVVTGGSRGLGRAVAEAFAEEGARVTLVDVIEPSPELPPGGPIEYERLDVTDPEAVEATFAKIASERGGLDILANNAGIAPPASRLIDVPPETVDRVLDVNLKGMINCSRAAIRILLEQGRGGRIINTSSQYGIKAEAEWAVYSASKFAVNGLTQALALEHAADGILVNAICPGNFLTEMSRAAFDDRAERAGVSPEEAIQKFAAEQIPLERMGLPEEMGRLAVWLASDDCSFTTGSAINLTGGEMVF